MKNSSRNNGEIKDTSAMGSRTENPDSDKPHGRSQENTGDWTEQRESTRTDDEAYDDEKNDNTGGAGSTGSAATNS